MSSTSASRKATTDDWVYASSEASPWTAPPNAVCQYQEAEGHASTGVNTRNANNANPADRRRQIGGAAAVGGIAGFIFMGPVVALVVAGGVAVAAATGKGAVGDVARATGDVACHAGDRVQQFNRKHKKTKKTSRGIVKGCHWVSKKISGP